MCVWSGSACPIQLLTLVVVAAPAIEPGSESEALQHKAKASEAFTQETSSQGRHCTARRSRRPGRNSHRLPASESDSSSGGKGVKDAGKDKWGWPHFLEINSWHNGTKSPTAFAHVSVFRVAYRPWATKAEARH